MLWLYCTEGKGNLAPHILFQPSQHLPLFFPAALFNPSDRLSEVCLRLWLRGPPNRALCRSRFCKPNDFHSPVANRVSKGRFLTAMINHSLIYKANKSRCRYSWLSLVQSTGVFASCVGCHGAPVLQRVSKTRRHSEGSPSDCTTEEKKAERMDELEQLETWASRGKGEGVQS